MVFSVNKLKEESIESSLIQRTVSYQAILPADYENNGKKYPVLYLLHGLFGSYQNWVELTDLKTYAEDCNFIIVLPDAGDSWYTDGAGVGTERIETFFLEEFIPAVESLYEINGQKSLRAVAGISMGGYGALKFALKRPDLFSFAGSMSGAFEAPLQHDEHHGTGWVNMGVSISNVFGDKDSLTRPENDVFRLVRRTNSKKIFEIPKLYIDCGKEDAFLNINRELVSLLEENGLDFEYKEVPGGHDWTYWNKQIKEILRIVGKHFLDNGD